MSIAALGVIGTDDVVVITKGGQLVRTPVLAIRDCGRGTQGVKVVGVNEGDSVVAAARVAEGEAKPEGEAKADMPPESPAEQ